MTDFKFAKECSEKGKEFDNTYFFYDEKKDIWTSAEKAYIQEEDKRIFYPNPSEEDLSKRLPNVIYYKDSINEYYQFRITGYPNGFICNYVDYSFRVRAWSEENFLFKTGSIIRKTKKECYQKAILKLNDMELLK